MKRTPKVSRAEKAHSGSKPVVRKSFNDHETYGFNSFKLTESQAELSSKISNNTLTFVEGVAGSGKSVSILYTFVKEYLRDNTKQIIIIRTPVEAGMDKIGALPNDYKAKVEPHFESTRKLLVDMLSKNKVENDMDHRIHFKIPNYVLGATFDNALVLLDECFTDKHEFLTPSGWKNVKDIAADDLVYQCNEDGTGEFVSPLRTVHKEYKGDIIEYNVSNVSYSVTANHRMVYKDSKDALTVKLAKEASASNWNFLTSTQCKNDVDFNITDEKIKLDVAMQADGSCSEFSEGRPWQITMSRERKLERFFEIDQQSKYFHEVKGSSEEGNTKARRRFYSGSYVPDLLSNSKEKNFCLDTLNKLSFRQKKLFIEELAHWDGSFYNESDNFIYCTTNKHNVDVVQAICAMTGFSTNISKSVDNRKESYKDHYKLSIKKTNSRCTTQKHDKQKEVVAFEGMVHCVTVPSGMVITRCNNKVHVSGNCQQLQPQILKLLLERTGINSRVVVAGDNTQLYASNGAARNALKDAIPRFFDKDGNPFYEDTAYHKFGVQDIMRSDIVKTVVTAYTGLL